MKKIKIIVEKSKTGFSAYAPDYPGVFSLGTSWDHVRKGFAEAFAFHLEGMAEDGALIPKKYQLEFCLDLGQFFKHYKVFNVTALATYLKINPKLLHQYKDDHKIASEKTSTKIIQGIQDFANELLSSA